MEITGFSASMVASGGSVQTGDAVAVSVQKKAMDIQQSQAQQLIQSVEQSVPKPQTSSQSSIDVYV